MTMKEICTIVPHELEMVEEEDAHLSVDYPRCTLTSRSDNRPSHMGHPVPAGARSKMERPVN
jgi:hypothetical protein